MMSIVVASESLSIEIEMKCKAGQAMQYREEHLCIVVVIGLNVSEHIQ